MKNIESIKLNNRKKNIRSLRLFSLLFLLSFFICTPIILTSCSIENKSEETGINTSVDSIVSDISKTFMMSHIHSITKEERPINSAYIEEVCLNESGDGSLSQGTVH